MNEQLSDEKLQQRCTEWQDVLNLKDWTVELAIIPQDQMPRVGAMGYCSMTPTRKDAQIRLLQANDYPALRAAGARLRDTAFEQERTLVHELLHIPFAALDGLIGDGTVAEVVLEQAISSIDHVLVDLAMAARAASLVE